MRVLVTGGAGYVGSVTCEVLLERGYTIGIVDNLVRGHKSAIPARTPFWKFDLRDEESLGCCFSEFSPHAVLHFAAFCLVGESMENPALYFENNVGGSLSLLKTMVSRGVKAIVFSSSAAVYGQAETTPIQENHRIHPTNAYGASKVMVEEMLKWFWESCGVRSVSLRYFNAAGATRERGEDHDPETHLIPLALGAAVGKRGPLHVFGRDYPTRDGTCIRDYIHVLDLACAHLLALERVESFQCEAFNLGTGVGSTVGEVIRTVEDVTGLRVPAVSSARRKGDPAALVASNEKARDALGWTAQFSSLPHIVESAYAWMKAYPDGYRGEEVSRGL